MSKFKQKIGILFLCTLMFNFSIVQDIYANDDDDFGDVLEYTDNTTETVSTGAVQVTATRSAKDLLEVPMAVTVITAEEIRKKSAITIAQLLNDIPGVTYRSSAPGGESVSIRGSEEDNTLILVDGQKLSYFGVDAVSFFANPAIIERIEVIRGPASVLYGSNAMGGVINIITKKGGVKPIQGEFRQSFNSITEGFATDMSVFGSKNNFNYRIGGTYENANDYDVYITDLPYMDKENYNINAFLSYDFNENVTVGGAIDYYKKTGHSHTSAVSSSSATGTWNTATTYSYTEYSMPKYSVFGEFKNFATFLPKVRFDAYYQDYKTSGESSISKTTGLPSSYTDNSLITTGITLQADWQVKDHTFIITGYELTYEKLDNLSIARSTTTHTIRQGDQTTNAAFISIEHSLPYNFALNYGMRYTHIETGVTKDGTSLEGVFTASSTPGSNTESKPVFNVGLVWTGIENLAIRATYSQGFKAPSFYEKYVETWAGGANPNLKSETSDNYEIGVRYAGESFNADVAVFYNIVDNLIIWDWDFPNMPSDWYYTYNNVAEARIYGLEFAFDYTFNKGTAYNNITPYISGTYMRRKYRDNGEWDYEQAYPILSGRLGVRYSTLFNDDYFRLSADAYVTGQSKLLDPDQDVDAFMTANLELGLEWGDDKQYFAQANIYNVGDAKYQIYSYANAYQPGINTSLIFGYRF